MDPVKATTRREYTQRMLQVVVHIQNHLDDPLTLDDLARVAHFSPFHFHRIFRGMVGESVAQYVRRLRLERAAFRLRCSDRPITDIAFETGYETHESFTRAFRSAFGLAPSAYRHDREARATLAAPANMHYTPDAEDTFRPLTLEDHPMNVEVRTIEPMRVAFIRHVGPYHEVGRTWERLYDFAGRHGLFGPDTRMFGACHDDPEVTAAEHIRYDACITVDDSVEGEGEVGVQTLGGGRYAVALHEGPYDHLGETYAALFGRWLPACGHEPGPPPCLELYLNDPESTEPEDLLTDVCVRLL